MVKYTIQTVNPVGISKFVFRANVYAFFISFCDVPRGAGGCLLLVHLSFKSNERHRLAGSD